MLERTPVALGDDRAAVHHDHGERRCQRAVLVEHLVEQRVEVDALGHRGLGPPLGRPGDVHPLTRQRDQVGHAVAAEDRPAHGGPTAETKKDSNAVFVSVGRSCWTQCPAPSITVAPRKSGSASAMASAAPGIMMFTGSSDPVMKPVGMA